MKTFLYLFLIGLLIFHQPAFSASSIQITKDSSNVFPSSPVVLEKDTLFYVYSKLGPFTAGDRANAIIERLKSMIENYNPKEDTLQIIKGDKSSDILLHDVVLMTVTDEDAKVAGKTRDALVKFDADKLLQVIKEKSESNLFTKTLLAVLFGLAAVIVFIVLMKLSSKIFPRIYEKIKSANGKRIKAFKIQTLEVFSSDKITTAILYITKIFRLVLTIIAAYTLIAIAFSFFPQTKEIASNLFNYLMKPINIIINAVISFLPNLFMILIIAAVAHYVNRFFKLIARAVGNDKISIPGFYKDWAIPTYKIIRFVVIAFSAAMIFPYIPGSNSTAFQGLSVFLGVVISFGSSSSISNIIAGIILTYTRAFDNGDRVKIGDTVGDVLEKTLLVLRVRTIKNVDITIPNSVVLGSHIINYSRSADKHGLILHTNVTIGYDVPWRKVHELLLNAAARTKHLLDEPKPFVYQQSLDDFYVNYELNVYTNESNSMASIYSELHQNIQDSFNESGVEIMSPHYAALRDGNQVTLPANHLPAEYQAPGFRLFNFLQRNTKG